MKKLHKVNILLIINLYDSPPWNYFNKYLNQSGSANLTILKLGLIRISQNHLMINSFIREGDGNAYNINRDVLFPLPYFMAYFAQGIINIFLFIYLLLIIRKKTFDIIIGASNLNGVLAYILKIIRNVKFSIYYNSDILPDINSSKKCFFLPNVNSKLLFFSKIIDSTIIIVQYVLRKISYKNDLVLYGTKKIEEWDKKRGFISKQKIIFNGGFTDYHEYIKNNNSKKKLTDICYFGKTDDYVGLEIIIPALSELKKTLPNIKLHIIGGDTIGINKFRDLSIKYKVLEHINFHGYIPNLKDAYKIMSHCSLGLALYRPVKDNISFYTTPGKPRDYLNVGLPVLVTKNGPQIGKDILKYNAGIEAEFNKDSVASSIEKTLTDRKYYQQLEKGVEKFVKENDYYNVNEEFWFKLEKLLLIN